MKSVPTKTLDNSLITKEECESKNAIALRPTVGNLFITHIIEVPDIIPVSEPVFPSALTRRPFFIRLGAAIIYLIHHVEYSISPSGRLRTWLKLLFKWFVTLSLLCLAVGVVGSIAASFIESISKLLMLAAQHIFMCVLYLFGTIVLLALLISGAFFFLSAARQKHQHAQDFKWGRNNQDAIDV